ncbi:MAG: transcription initiation factor IIB [Candidatus Thermoplasmatota archaeon]|nr:transcription initiation factor IIB [Candidatus Thermoplasmatota archaeon]
MTDKKKQKIEETTICPKCKSTHLSRDNYRAELVCDDCGLVIEENLIDYGPEWRAFDSEQREKRSRVGAPMTYMIHDKGLSTTIDWKNKDSYGRSIPTRNKAQMYRLRRWQKRIRISNAVERNLMIALSALDRMSSAMGIPRNVRETAAMIYRKAALKNLVRGRSIEDVAAAALYAACRQCHAPRTLDEISKIANIPKRNIGRNYRFVSRELKLKLMPTLPEDYISRFCSGLKLNGEVKVKATEILKEVEDKEITNGQNPISIAAASLYIASVLCDERRTQSEIANEAGVTEVTIRNHYKNLAEKLDIEITL